MLTLKSNFSGIAYKLFSLKSMFYICELQVVEHCSGISTVAILLSQLCRVISWSSLSAN